jgi:hypothetical protein
MLSESLPHRELPFTDAEGNEMIPMLAIVSGPIIAVIAGIAILAVGVDRLPKVARSLGRMRLNFLQGQTGSPVSTAGEQSRTVTPPDDRTR